MKIIQLTDLHLGREGEDTNGIDVRSNFLKGLDLIKEITPDCLVISGDLCYRAPEREIYEWAKGHLDQLPFPYQLISGNHDDPAMMADVFGLEENLREDGIYYTKSISGEDILFLDTTPARMDAPQLDWLTQQLEQYQKDLIIFMHHPPMFCNVPFMDIKHAFKTRDEVQQIFFDHGHNLTIFTGHYHIEKTIRIKNLEVNITPSTFFQIGQVSEEFEVDHRRPGFRIIEKNGEQIGHTVVYFE